MVEDATDGGLSSRSVQGGRSVNESVGIGMESRKLSTFLLWVEIPILTLRATPKMYESTKQGDVH